MFLKLNDQHRFTMTHYWRINISLIALLTCLFTCPVAITSQITSPETPGSTPATCPCTFVSTTELDCSRRNVSLENVNECNVSSIIKLDLRWNLLTTLDWNDFENFTHLEELNLDFNRFLSVPSVPFNILQNLTRLSLVANFINKIDPSALHQLVKLKHLSLGQNKLREASSISFPSPNTLQYLDLSKNSLTNLLPQTLENLTHLQELNLNTNSISELPNGLFTGLTELHKLSLGKNKVSHIPECAFQNLSALKKLDLSDNLIDSYGAVLQLTSLTNLNLSSNRIQNVTCGTYNQLTNLRKLSLRNNSLSYIPECAFNNLSALTELDLSNNRLDSYDAVRQLTSLTYLNLSSNRIQNVTCGTYNHLTNLKKLSLRNNSLSYIPECAFNNLSALTELDLSNNPLNSYGAVRQLMSLIYLNLTGNTLIGIEHLPKNTSIYHLKMPHGSYNISYSRDSALNSSNYTCHLKKLTGGDDPHGNLSVLRIEWQMLEHLNISEQMKYLYPCIIKEEMSATFEDSSPADSCIDLTPHTTISYLQDKFASTTGSRLQCGKDTRPSGTDHDDSAQNSSTTNTTSRYQCLSSLLDNASLNTAEEVNRIMDITENMQVQARNSPNNEIMSLMTRVLSLLMNLSYEVLEKAQAQCQVAERMLRVIDEIANRMQPDGLPFSSSNLIIGAQALYAHDFRQCTITVPKSKRGTQPVPENDDNVCKISLPPSVLYVTSDTRITYAVLRDDKLLEVMRRVKQKKSSKPHHTSERRRGINSYVMSATVKDKIITNSTDEINITLLHIIKNSSHPTCVFWNADLLDWSPDGCKIINSTNSYTVCKCDHLTHFALLMDIYGAGESLSKQHQTSLKIVSNIGCSLSMVALLITLLTYGIFENLRRDIPSKLLINLSLALMVFNMVFVFGLQEYSLNNSTVCKIVAVLLHYSLLSAFCWMAVESFYMYFSLVVVFRAYFSKLILKCSLFAWGVPLVIVIITLSVNKTDNYGSSSGNTCWLAGLSLYLAFAIPVFIILIVNFTCFTLVMRQLTLLSRTKLSKSNTVTISQQLRGAFGVCVLLGLTWVFSVFLFDKVIEVFSYLFVICNSLQGLFIFVHNCLLKNEVRNAWFSCKQKSKEETSETILKLSMSNRDSDPDARKIKTPKYPTLSL